MNESPRATKYFFYARKSTEEKERQMLSIPSQLEEGGRLVEARQLSLVCQPFKEERSAKAVGRPVFNEMIERIENGEADGIVCWKLDRLARNPLDGAKIMDLLQREVIKEIHTPSSVYTPATDMLVLAVEFGMATQFIRDLSRNVKRGLRKKAQMGVPNGVASIGFLNDKAGEKGNKRWLEDPDRFHIVKQLLQLFLTGRYSGRSLWRLVDERFKLTTPKRKKLGGKPLSLSATYRLLANPIYAGFFYLGGERFELDRNLRRMISEDEYWRIQSMLGVKGRPRPKKRQALYGPFMRCGVYGCGVTADHKFHLVCSGCRHKFSYIHKSHCPRCGISIENMESPVYRTYVYYQSSRERKIPGVKALCVEERAVSKFLEDYVASRFTVSPALSAWCTQYIGELRDKELRDRVEANRSVRAAHDEAKRQRTELIRMRARGMIDDEEYVSLKAEYDRNVRQTSLRRGPTDWSVRAKEIVDLSERLLGILRSGSMDEKREALIGLRSNLVLAKGKLD